MRFKSHSWVTTSVKHEGSLLSRRMNMVVVLEFCKGQQVFPIILAFIHKESDILFEFLVNTLSLAISLGMVRCGGCQLDAQQAVELPCEVSHKLGPSIGKNIVRKTMQLPDIAQVEASRPQGRDSGVSGIKWEVLETESTTTITAS